jgi:hypothetical protein
VDVELAAGFAAVIASLLAVALLVVFSHRIIEKTHRKSLETQREAGLDRPVDADRGDSR